MKLSAVSERRDLVKYATDFDTAIIYIKEVYGLILVKALHLGEGR